ncbi:MAG: adenosylcobinamide amidohydrolase [Desulfobacteraceae bacterium]|nr:adenosylcobinamide amidohydrolase [Desulfobacteraceae bacterium]
MAASLEFVDAAGRRISLDAPPQRVVSLVPAVTEMIFALGAGDRVRAVTYHDTWPPEAAALPVVGGFAAPDVQRVAAVDPEVVFVSSLHGETAGALGAAGVQPIALDIDSIQASDAAIRRLGEIFQRQAAAETLVDRIHADLDLAAAKVAKIPAGQRLRVMRFMGGEQVMAPGDKSFQNEMIRAAGGIPPEMGQTGDVVAVTLEQWQRFNPQVIYGCGGDRQVAARLLDRPGWRDVEAVKNKRLIFFPCDLTCRCGVRTPDFVAWLASRLYAEAFARQGDQIYPDALVGERHLILDLPYVARAGIVESRIHDFVNKTLVVDFNRPMSVVSTLEGQREGVLTVGNHYWPPPCWSLGHAAGLASERLRVCRVLERRPETTALLFTGADMDRISVQRRSHREITVTALVTAGVESNAQRAGCDVGQWCEPGTINIILMTNMQLSSRAMTRALITATEAKTAALQDLDIRSSVAPHRPATGTGTDNIIVVQGAGTAIDNAGGHSKMGQLIAEAVDAGVQEAIFKQNGIAAGRPLMRRMAERGVDLWALVADAPCDCAGHRGELGVVLERLLLEERYTGFIEAAIALDDARTAGRKTDLSLFDEWCCQVAAGIAGAPVPLEDQGDSDLASGSALQRALEAMLDGVKARLPEPQGALVP